MLLSRLKLWIWLHKWSSLIAMLVMLVVFVSGLPLVFKAEIEYWLGYGTAEHQERAEMPLDSLVAAAEQRRKDKVVQFIVWEDNKPGTVIMSMADTPDEAPYHNISVLVSPYDGQIVNDEPEPLAFFSDLHTQLLMGKGGTFFLGIIAISLVLSLVSGVMIYAPFAGRRPFGTVRNGKSKRAKWLDVHNVVGIIVFGWMLVVGGTGLINSWGEYLVYFWRADQVADMTRDYHNKAAPEKTQFGSAHQALEIAKAPYPEMVPWFIAMPGSMMSDAHHYTIYLRGGTSRTAQLVRPVLVDAVTQTITDSREMPWYMKTLMLSQPLHFGDYGGFLLKLIWFLFTLISTVLLMTGLYLWWVRRKQRYSADNWQELLES